jgi:DNA mismatch endonuclease, patch repair protein
MADIVDRATRSRMMSGIRGKHTKPERIVRSFLHRQGLRFRLHDRSLPGRPDLVLKKHKAVINVHGCFWHQHKGCRFAYTPASNPAFWRDKLAGNVERDRKNDTRLRVLGWRVLTIWECEVGNPTLLDRLRKRILKGR